MIGPITKVLVLAFILGNEAAVKFKVAKYKSIIESGGQKSTCAFTIYHTHSDIKLKKANKRDKVTTITCKGKAKGLASTEFEVGNYKFSFEFSPAKKSKIISASVVVGPPSCPCGRSLVCPVSCSGKCPTATSKICPLVPVQQAETRTESSTDYSHCTCDLNINIRMMIGLTNHKGSALLGALDNGEATPMHDDAFCACVDSKLNIPS